MVTKRVKVADLHGAEKNVRRHPQKQLDEIKRSYRMYGQYRPLVVADDGEVLVGNGFFEAMKQEGIEEVDAVILPKGTSETDKKKLMLSDNKIFGLGQDDLSNIDEILSSIEDFDIAGFDEDVLTQLYAPVEMADPIVSGAGDISARVAQIQQEARRRAETPDADDPAKYEVHHAVVEDRASVDREDSYITCPHCGVKIYGYRRS